MVGQGRCRGAPPGADRAPLLHVLVLRSSLSHPPFPLTPASSFLAPPPVPPPFTVGGWSPWRSRQHLPGPGCAAPAAVRARGPGRAAGGVPVARLSAPPLLTQISPSFSPNQFTFIASAAQKQFFKNKKVSTSKTNQFWESSCRHCQGTGGPAPPLPSGPLPQPLPQPLLQPHHFYCFMMPVISRVFETPRGVPTT